jgi:hypothetical protein
MGAPPHESAVSFLKKTAQLGNGRRGSKSMTAITKEGKAAERREKARLRSERTRRARGIMPRKKARKAWLAEGISRSTWYRRRKRAREQAAPALATAARQATLERLEWQLSLLRSDLERCARFTDQGAAIIAELAAMASCVGSRLAI